MPRPEYAGRCSSIIWSSPEEKAYWEKYAKEHNQSLSGLVPVALEALKAQESNVPKQDIITQEDLKAELQATRQDLRLKDAVLERAEAELYRLKYKDFTKVKSEGEGSRKYDLDLIKLLKEGKTLDSSCILEGLGIDPDDAEATKLVWNQLEALQEYGLCHETRFGWRWNR